MSRLRAKPTPYSLLMAHSESLPEEGEVFSTTSFVPFQVNVTSLSIQVNQTLLCNSKLKVCINNNEFIFELTKDNTTKQQSCNFNVQNMTKVTIENMKDDEGDVSTCSLFIHGHV